MKMLLLSIFLLLHFPIQNCEDEVIVKTVPENMSKLASHNLLEIHSNPLFGEIQSELGSNHGNIVYEGSKEEISEQEDLMLDVMPKLTIENDYGLNFPEDGSYEEKRTSSILYRKLPISSIIYDEEDTSENASVTAEYYPVNETTFFDYGDEHEEDSLTSRYAPSEPPSHSTTNPYILPEERLKKIRGELMYWFFDKGGSNNDGDRQKDIQWSMPQIHKNFNFQLPFFGFRFNYTRLSLNGYLEFSDPPEQYTYPLTFPNKEWPRKNDPSFIGIFFSKCRIGRMRPDEADKREPGVYFRLERDLMTRTDKFGVEVRERLIWDIREGVVGSESFVPKHAIIVTWKNVSFAGGIENALYKTNTFQMILATDEVYTYAIFNYKDLQWTTHTEANGDTTGGEGGIPAFVGFNAGNGTRSFEYMPYSQNSVIRDLTGRGWANGFPGRHIFRIDENIMLGTCNKDIAGTHLPLIFAPESGNMLGGTLVNITGPCFEPEMRVRCRFDTEEVIGNIIDRNRAICVQPFLMAEGYIPFEVSVGDGVYNWKGKFFVETPATAAEKIYFNTKSVHEKDPAEIEISWDSKNFTMDDSANLRISIWGYKETTIRPQLMYIDEIEESVRNTGHFIINTRKFINRRNKRELLDLHYGFLHINLTNPIKINASSYTPVLWSRPIPLAWYFGPQWELEYGSNWPEVLCDKWTMYDRYLKNFASEVHLCPCTLQHALLDKGRYLPDPTCDIDSNHDCYYNRGAVHCVRSGAPSLEGSEQQCCYDKNHYLMLSYDQQWGSRPRRSHNLGFIPWNEANKVPTLSQWFHDMIPFYMCCLWQDEQAVGCETMRFERRPSQDCVAFQSPYVATVFGDPHVITFDEYEYTFNGKGEFVLVQANSGSHKLNIQGRFEQVSPNIYGSVNATILTAIAAQDNSSSVIEVHLRPTDAQWRYRLDVLADGKRIYFDRPSLKVQHFPGVTVYTPSYILNQSEVIIMFPSGAGVEVIENKGFMAARVYLPLTFVNKTKGLFGNWSFNKEDDFVLPSGEISTAASSNLNSFENIHRDFAMHWILEEREENEKGPALFTREHGRMGNYYSNRNFVPEFHISPQDIIPANRSYDIEEAHRICESSYQCRYDYALTLNKEMAHYTLNYYKSYKNIQRDNKKRIISCGVLETPRFGRKSNFFYTPGAKVAFECNQDFTLIGDQRRICLPDGQWNVPATGETECLRRVEYEQRQGWISAGVILGVLIPIVLFIAMAYIVRNKNRDPPLEKPDNCSMRSWKDFTNRSTLRKSSPKDFMKSPPEIIFEDEGLIEGDSKKRRTFDKIYKGKGPLSESNFSEDKPDDYFGDISPSKLSDEVNDPSDTKIPKKRTYDKTYRTLEPLPGKPDVDFSQREDNLRSVSVEDLEKFKESVVSKASSKSSNGESSSDVPKSDETKYFSESSESDENEKNNPRIEIGAESSESVHSASFNNKEISADKKSHPGKKSKNPDKPRKSGSKKWFPRGKIRSSKISSSSSETTRAKGNAIQTDV